MINPEEKQEKDRRKTGYVGNMSALTAKYHGFYCPEIESNKNKIKKEVFYGKEILGKSFPWLNLHSILTINSQCLASGQLEN